MSQVFFNAQPGDHIAEVCNANFTELYSAKTTDEANITLALTALNAGTPFKLSANLTAAAAATPVHIVPAASVTGSKKVYVEKVFLKVGGATDWTDITATKVQIQDTAGTPIVGLTFAKALLVGNAVISDAIASTMLASMTDGFTAAKGIDIVADAIFAAGSTITVIVYGYIA